MEITRKRVTSLALVLLLAMSMFALSACGKDTPKDAQGAFDAYTKAMESVDTYHGDFTADIEVGAGGGEGMSMSIPIKIAGDMDASKESAHANMNMSVTMFGENQKEAVELYMNLKDGTMYTKSSDSDSWSKSENSSLDMTKLSKPQIPEEMLKQMVFEDGDKSYKVTCDLTKIDLKELLKNVDLGDATEDLNLDDLDNLTVKSGSLEYVFDKESALMTEMKISDAVFEMKADEASAKSDEMALNMDMSVTINMSLKMSAYNKVDKSKVEIPKDVISGAQASDDNGLDDISEDIAE